MNGQSKQSEATRLNAAEFEQQWQEAKRCNVKQKPCPEPYPHPEPRPEPCPIICERDSEEINIYFNAEQSNREQSNHGRSGIWSWLPWLLLGLTSLLLLGNLFMMYASAQSTNRSTDKEVTNTINRSREVVRIERSEPEPYCHNCPSGRW